MKQINNYKNNIVVLLLIAVTGGLFTGCSAPDELTEITYARVFSINEENLTVNVTNSTTLRLTWDKVQNADGYTIELFADDETMQFAGTPSVIEENIEYQSPYLIPNLDGETFYSGRIKGVSNTTSDSHWTTFSFQTAMENIFNAIGDGLGATSVTLSWEPGLDVTHIIIRDLEGNEVTRHDITPEEITAGKATVNGLEGNTSYTAQIYNNTKSRGSITFTTDPDLGDAIQVYPEDDLGALIGEAEDGDVFALMPGEYIIGSGISVTKSISIIAAISSDRPILVNTNFALKAANINLSFKNLIIDGESNQTVVTSVDNGLTAGEISFDGCNILNYQRGFVTPSNNEVEILSYKINDCIVENVGGSGNEVFDFRTAVCRNMAITNSTFSGVGNNARYFIRMDNAGYGIFGGSVTVLIDQCTFYNSVDTDNRSILYVQYSANNCTFTNCIVANTAGQLALGSPNLTTRNNIFYATSSIAETGGNPGFADPENGDFTVTNEDVYFSGAGDPRWLK
ncbi:MAG: fibronectin type III domain-containing protein [Tannerellaceae bacterium]|nr:fibronectin type III domain-containing protein [Tannerellaceae bacterium]